MTSPECERDPTVVGEVAEVLPPTGPRQTIVVVGGSLLALYGRRQNAGRGHGAGQQSAAEGSGGAGGAGPRPGTWVNDSSAAFCPQTLVEEDCRDVRLDRDVRRVCGSVNAR